MTAVSPGCVWLRERILAAGHTQASLARALGVGTAKVNQWCLGVRPVSRANVEAVCGILGVTAEQLAGHGLYRPGPFKRRSPSVSPIKLPPVPAELQDAYRLYRSKRFTAAEARAALGIARPSA